MDKNIIKPIDDAITTVVKNNNRNCYLNGYFDGYLVGTLFGAIGTVAGYICIKTIYNIGKANGKREAQNTFTVDIPDDKEE